MGNRLTEEKKTTPAGTVQTTNYTYDDANRMTSAGGVAYTWDDNGNLLNDGANTYTYNHGNRLTMIDGSSSTISFAYNGLGDRLSETINGVTTIFTLDLNTGLTQVLADGSHVYLYGLGRIVQITGLDCVYFLGDALGSVRQLANGQGIVILARSYEPYGSVLSTVGEDATKYGFTGEWQDSTGLSFLRARFYDSNIGRFINKDSWKGEKIYPSSYNVYQYGYENPIMFTDPGGKQPYPCLQIDQDQWQFTPGCPGYLPAPLVSDKITYDVTKKPDGVDFWGMEINTASQILQNNPDYSQFYPINPETGEIFLYEGEPWALWGYNLCGQISLEMILETITGTKYRLGEIVEALNTTDTTNAYQLAIAAALTFPKHRVIKGHNGFNYVLTLSSSWDKEKIIHTWGQPDGYWAGDDSDISYSSAIESQLRKGRFTILCANCAGKDCTLVPKSEGVGHWIVLTGMSVHWNHSSMSDPYNWVRILNPFRNRIEYYHWSHFSASRGRAMIEIYYGSP